MTTLSRAALAALHLAEQARYRDTHPRSAELAARGAAHFLFGVPMHWMRDWPTPFPLHVAQAQGNRLTCVDGMTYLDYCLADTGAMFGHSPEAVARALADRSAIGLAAMLPSDDAAAVGELLSATFGLPCWQLTLSASDANRFVLRWARAITGRAKVLVFDGCYHGTVDDTLVDQRADGRVTARASLLGQVHDLADTTRVVPFNDLAALDAALEQGDVACLLAEPALTNCGLVLPAPGFWPAAQAACKRHGVLLAFDETHTLSAGHGGHARVEGLEPDLLVVGKSIAGGFPCAAYGFTDTVRARIETAKRAAPEGHSGIGTTLSASLLALAALRAQLGEVMTAAAHERMDAAAADLQQRLSDAIAGMPWCISRFGARLELQFRATLPRDAAEARAAMDDELERALHLFLLNRGVLVTPFHDMLLVCPSTRSEDNARVATLVGEFLTEVCA